MRNLFRLAGFALVLLLALPAEARPKGSKLRDIADTINANPILTRFAQLMQASPDTFTFLSSRGPFTVFVPTDSAFAKMSPDAFAQLTAPQNKERLQHILLFHVVNGKSLAAKDLAQYRAIFSAEGNPLVFKLTHTKVQLVLNSGLKKAVAAKIVHSDIHCANGIIHEVDTVLMPPEGALPKIKLEADAPTREVESPAVTPVSPTGTTNAGDIPVAPVAGPEVSPP